MSGIIDIHTEILSDAQVNLLHALSKAFMDTDFYLAGGTALALKLGHRLSKDFDWFINRLGDPEDLFRRLRSADISFTVLSTASETVYLNIDSIQASFIGYDYPLLEPPGIASEKYQFRIAGYDDIACMKLSAIASRGSRKDFVDLYYLIKNFKPLESYLELYIKKYKNRDIGHVIRSLVYFRDAEEEPELTMIAPLDWIKTKSDFEGWVNNISR
ncbi:MAG: nucleotidyl transferase AbiEii/AbiGii toxin family protein [Deltaproteobacteria bacterium]|nr:nucleotidyl transferase AbiEii/AbiGii toxin family protein [Deltaproteobacteria bacterium]